MSSCWSRPRWPAVSRDRVVQTGGGRQAPRDQAAARRSGRTVLRAGPRRRRARAQAAQARRRRHHAARNGPLAPQHGGGDPERRSVRGGHPPARAARRGRDRRGAVGERQADARRVRRAPARARHLHVDRHAPARSRAGDLGRPGLDRGVDLSAGEQPAAPLRAGVGRARRRGRRPGPVPGADRRGARPHRRPRVDQGRRPQAGGPRGRSDRDRPGRPAQGVHAARAGRSVPAGDGPRGGADGRAAFRPGRGDVGRDDDRRSRAPARDARRPPRRAAARREGDDAGRGLGRVADRRGGRRRRLAGGAREDRRHPVGGRAAPRTRAARSRRTRAQDRGRRGAVRRASAQDGFPGTAWPRRWPCFATRAFASPSSRSARARCRAALASAAAETGGEAIAVHAFDESLPFLADALRPRPGHPALDARGEGEWHVLRTVTGERRLDRTRARMRRSRRTPRRPAPTRARRWRSISRRCGIARASNGTTATPPTRSRRC